MEILIIDYRLDIRFEIFYLYICIVLRLPICLIHRYKWRYRTFLFRFWRQEEPAERETPYERFQHSSVEQCYSPTRRRIYSLSPPPGLSIRTAI